MAATRQARFQFIEHPPRSPDLAFRLTKIFAWKLCDARNKVIVAVLKAAVLKALQKNSGIQFIVQLTSTVFESCSAINFQK